FLRLRPGLRGDLLCGRLLFAGGRGLGVLMLRQQEEPDHDRHDPHVGSLLSGEWPLTSSDDVDGAAAVDAVNGRPRAVGTAETLATSSRPPLERGPRRGPRARQAWSG